MSALEVESLLRKMAALRERDGRWPLDAGFELKELYTVLETIHDKILRAEPLVNSRSSAAYSLFTDDLRRVTISVDEALDKFSSTSSGRLYGMLRPSLGKATTPGPVSAFLTGFGLCFGPLGVVILPQLVVLGVFLPRLRDQAILALRPKVVKQFEEEQRDLQMLLHLFSTYVADLLPKHPQPVEVVSDTPLEDTFSSWQEHALIGRKQDMENLLRISAASETEVFAVVGMAGVGKTALARAVYMAAKDEGFDYCLWMNVSQEFDPEKIFRGLMALLSEYLHHGEDPDSFWWSMKEGLVNKKYMVVLDNVWNEDPRKWNKLLHLLSGKKAPGSRIIVTTRIRAAAAAIQSATTYNLLPFSIEDSLELFKTTTVDSIMKQKYNASGSEGFIIREVAERCSGLPMLVNLMNILLTEDTYQREANHVMEEFDTRCMNDKGLLGIAKASYDHLPSYLRRCFLYCSLFPPDHIFDAEEMTGLWISEGLAQVSSRESHVDGDFSQLLDECFNVFYESGPRAKMRYKMQFILYNFARNRGNDLYKAIKVEDYNRLGEQSIRYMSLMVDHTTKELPVSLIEQKDLRTLILLRSQDMVLCCQRSEIRKIPSDYCRYLTALRVLDLHATRIDRLPDTFDMLLNMRYLNLSQTDITKLPESFDKLQYLIYLNISLTHIVAVPELIGKIKSLRYLNLSQTCVRELPETIGDLRFLQTLQMSHCKKLVKLPRYIVRLMNLQKLDLEGCHHLSEIPRDISSMKSLKELNILECSSLDPMPIGLNRLSKIEVLPRYIAGSEGMILELQELRNLKTLGLHNLERVSALDTQEKWLEGNNKLESLTLHWNISIKNSSDMVQHNDGSQPIQENIISGVEQLIESLQPSKELKTLEIISYGGKRFPDWLTNSLPNLVEIKLFNVKCERFPPLGQLPLLATAEISGMDAIKHVSNELNGEDGTFRSLKKLTFSQMLNLESWPANGAICPYLEELSIIQCPKFQKLSMIHPIKKLTLLMTPRELLEEGGLAGVVSSLKSLSISLCEELSSPSDIEGLMVLSTLEELEISGCDELESLPSGMGSLTSLKNLSFIGCTKLRDVSELLKCTGLISLRISGCPMLTTVPPGLSEITTRECNNCGMMH